MACSTATSWAAFAAAYGLVFDIAGCGAMCGAACAAGLFVPPACFDPNTEVLVSKSGEISIAKIESV